MRETIDRLGQIWCGIVHDAPMWPIHGDYECRRCGRRHPVPWARNAAVLPARSANASAIAEAAGAFASFGIRKPLI
jgi:hypothetical protein